MASQAEFDQFVDAQRSVRTLAVRDVAAWWVTIESLSPSEQVAAAAAVVPGVAATYGEVAATLAADYYETARAESSAGGRFAARMAPSEAAAGVAGQLDWAMDPTWSGDQASALGRVSNLVDKWALQDGKNTMVANSERDPAKPRWARVPVGRTCAWCVMLGSRGAVYRSAASAGQARDFHHGDDCQVVPSWENGRDLPPSYDAEGLTDLYVRARAAAGSGSQKRLLQELRRLDGGVHVTDGVPN